MTNDARKTSQLPITTSLSANDRLVVLTNPATSAQTQTVTLRTLSNNIVRANTTTFGTVKVGDNLNVDINGFLNATLRYDGVFPITYVDSTTSYTVDPTDVIIFAVPNDVDQDIRIILPTENVAVGKEILIKNLDPGANHKVNVTTQAGISSGANYVEDHVTGAFVVNVEIGVKGETHTWIWDGDVWREVAELSAEPIFYSSTNSYHQVVIVNPSYANSASADWVAYNNEGDYKEGTGPFVDMGINSNNYSDTTYGDVWGPSDAYLYNYGGNLIIGPQTDHSIKFLAGNTNAEDVKLVINTTAISVNTDMIPVSDNTFSLGNSTHQWKSLYVTGNTIYVNSVPLGVDANNNLSIGNNVIASFTTDGYLNLPANGIVTSNGNFDITNATTISANTITANAFTTNIITTNDVVVHNNIFDDLHRPLLNVNALDINADGGTTSSVFGPSDTIFDGGAVTTVFGQYEAALDGGVSFNNRHSASFIDGGGAANQF